MGRTLGPTCRLCRREGIKLCDRSKCAIEKQWRNKPPGMHSWRRRKQSGGYGVRLREKQKVKRYYGVLEKQFVRYFAMAERSKSNTGEALLQLLERRLDNVVWKLGFASTHRAARQMVSHGHIYLNGRRVNRPGFLVRPQDRVAIKPSERSRTLVKSTLGDGSAPLQSWLQLDANNLEGLVVALPTREDVQIPVEEQLIIEFCSR